MFGEDASFMVMPSPKITNGTGKGWKAGSSSVSEIIELIKEYFLKKGYKVLNSYEMVSNVKPSIAFTDGKSTTFIKIFSKEELSDRNSLLDATLQTSKLLGKANRVYLALPKIYSTILDARIVQKHGLGLLVCSEKKIVEAIPAKFFESDIPDLKKLIKEIEDLKDLRRRVLELEQSVRLLTDEISRLKSVGIKVRELKPPSIEVPVPQELPSFFKDNPWLDILTRRGQERASA